VHLTTHHRSLAHEDVTFQYVKTEHMVADILTKAVPETTFTYCRSSMGIQ
jgi:hypothetical protein